MVMTCQGYQKTVIIHSGGGARKPALSGDRVTERMARNGPPKAEAYLKGILEIDKWPDVIASDLS